jgi:hypothetical protein
VSEVPVYLEVAHRSVFAVALEWPGWCRRGRDVDEALAALEDYRARYRAVVASAPARADLVVVGEVAGDATTVFGAPDIVGPWDEAPLSAPVRHRRVDALERAWEFLDAVVASAPATLTKGPRGGGRDRDAVLEHVHRAERAYARKVDVAVAPVAPFAEVRAALGPALRAGARGRWPTAYAIRRIAWHVLDHAWEVEDRSPGGA